MLTINGIPMKYNRKQGSYFGTTKAEPYNTGKNSFKPRHRTIYISSQMYPGTSKSFYYITSSISGKMRLYRHRDWLETEVANIFASGKTLQATVKKFERNLRNKVYNRGR